MDCSRLQARAPYLIMGLGGGLFLVAVVHHVTEFYAIDGFTGPVIALLLDGLPALGLVYAGYWLTGTELSPEGRWQVFSWCLGGAVLFVLIMGLSLLVRAFEGRVIGEALFPLLIAADAGGIAGFIAGYQTSRSRMETRRAQTGRDALRFVNSLIRHDLRNDLTVIHGHADLLDGETEPEDNGPAIIAEKAEEALTRIETTGAVAKTLSGDPDIERLDLAATAAEMATRLENTHNVSVTTDIPDVAPVAANRGLRSVIDNLLENAVEHNDADEPRIHVSVATNAGTVRLSIADNGPGIPDEQKERVLGARRGESERGGLSIVQTLVNEYGGELWIEDNEPRGSVLVVEFPRSETDPE